MSNRSSPRADRPSSTFITEMGNFKRSSNLNRTGRRNYNANSINRKKSNLPRISGSQSMFSSNFGRVGSTAEIEFDQGKLDHIYELLVKDIMDLKSDIAPIRHTYLKLKDRLLFQRQCSVNSNENFLLSEQYPDLHNAIGEGGTFSALIEEFQIEIDDNTNLINELKNKFSSYWTVKLSCENDRGRDELSAMKEMLSNLKSQKKRLNSNLITIKQSANIVKIDNQRKEMHKLILKIAKAEQRNQKLINSLQELEKEFDLSPSTTLTDNLSNEPTENPNTNKVKFILDDNTNNSDNDKTANKANDTTNNTSSNYNFNFMNTPVAQAAFDEVEALEKELAEKKQLYLKKCDELIIIRNKQLNQLQKLEKKQKSNQNNEENNNNNTSDKKFHVTEPKKPPTSSARARKPISSPQGSKSNQKDKTSNSPKSSNDKDTEENIVNKTSKMSNEELMSHLMNFSENSKGNATEELQEIPIEEEEEGGGVQVDDE